MRIRLLAITFLLFSATAATFAQTSDAPVSISLGTVRTEAEAAAVRVAAEYLESLPDIFNTSASDKSTGSILDLSPQVSLLTGDEDAFNGVVAKLSGNFIRFKTITDEEQFGPKPVPNTAAMFHAFPISVGIESDRAFRRVNSIAEFGYVPFYLGAEQWKLGLNPAIGVFLQAGYKSATDDQPADDETGGAVDESSEESDSALARLHVRARLNQPLGDPSKPMFRVIFTGEYWYDIANSTNYHRIDGTLRLVLSKTRNFDFKWENGSGPPNFNRGDQLSANLTITY